MTYEPPEFERCLGKHRSLAMVLQKEPMNGVYECGTCLRAIPNSPSHPESKTHCALIDPWPDFTPCQNFVALKWDAPVSDEALHKMVMDELPSLDLLVRKAVTMDLELGLLGSAFKQINQQQGWTMDGVDDSVKVRRTLIYDAYTHEMKRRRHAT